MIAYCYRLARRLIAVADVLVRNVPEVVLESLKRRSKRHRRSLQQELLCVLEAAADDGSRPSASELAATIRQRLAATGRAFSDSAELLREDRQG